MYAPDGFQQYQGYGQAKSPPPLQHPMPQHPIPNFDVQHPPPPPQQQQQQQQQYGYYQNPQHRQPYHAESNSQNMYAQFGFSDPAAQMGMQFAGNAVAQGTAYVEKNLNRWVDMPALRHYFNVSNIYVLSKLRLLLFPWRHSVKLRTHEAKGSILAKPWTRSINRNDTGQMCGYKPPREDINAPDLYIPVMAAVTYVLLCGLAAGRQGSFHPEKLYVSGSTSLAILFFEIMFTRLGCYFMSIPFEASMLDLVAYYGYKFVAIIVTDAVKMLDISKWLSRSVFIYTGISIAFFLLRSMRYVILPDVSEDPSTLNPQRKRRMWFLLIIAAMQIVYMSFLVY